MGSRVGSRCISRSSISTIPKTAVPVRSHEVASLDPARRFPYDPFVDAPHPRALAPHYRHFDCDPVRLGVSTRYDAESAANFAPSTGADAATSAVESRDANSATGAAGAMDASADPPAASASSEADQHSHDGAATDFAAGVSRVLAGDGRAGRFDSTAAGWA